MLGAITRFWQRSYAPDYLGLVLLLAAYQYVSAMTEKGSVY